MFYGRRSRYDWDGVHHLLGKRTDREIAQILGCHERSVYNTRKLLGIPRFRKADIIRPLLGKMPDSEVARRCGANVHTVFLQRRAEGIPPAAWKGRRRREARLKHARRMAEMEETGRHG